jgi:hypothetical protein
LKIWYFFLKKDTYLCYKVKVESTAFISNWFAYVFYSWFLLFLNKIAEFTPVSSKDIAHHMLLFGCSDPGQEEDVWFVL